MPEVGPHVHDRAARRREAHAAAVGVAVVGREAEVDVAIEVEVLLGDARGVPEDRLRNRHVVDDVVVRVGEVAGRRHEERDLRGCRAAGRNHEERDAVLGLALPDPQRVDAALHLVGHRQHDVRVPPAVVEIVIVKVDRAVQLRRVAEALLAAIPIPARHGAHGLVDADPEEVAARNVTHVIGRDAARADALGEVPVRDEAGARRRSAGCDRVELGLCELAPPDLRAVELAVEVAPRVGGGRDRKAFAGDCRHERGRRARTRARVECNHR